MKRLLIAAAITLPALSLGACAGDYYGGYGGGGYYGGPVGYDGFYDDYYGPIYDGYWGTDGAFYYRHGDHERRFHRGDPGHFHRGPDGPGGPGGPGGHFHPMQGQFHPGPGMRTPHFGGGGGFHGGPGGGFHGGGGHGGHH